MKKSKPMNVKLLIDHREHSITYYSDILSNIPYEEQQLQRGDYAVIKNDQILVAIERKTLDDYAASIKDGRSANIIKLLEIDGARIIYLIEGIRPSDINQRINGISYKAIESSIFHHCVRDGVCILWTQNAEDTAKMLVRFVQSMNTLTEGHSAIIAGKSNVSILHTARSENIQCKMWQAVPKIGIKTAQLLSKSIPFSALLAVHDDNMSTPCILNASEHESYYNLFNMIKLTSRQKDILYNIIDGDPLIHIAILSAIPQITQKNAALLLKKHTFVQLLNQFTKLSNNINTLVTWINERDIGVAKCERLVNALTKCYIEK